MPSEFIFEKKIYYLHVGNECIQKFHYDWRWNDAVQYHRSTFYYLVFRTAKMQVKRFFLSYLIRWNNTLLFVVYLWSTSTKYLLFCHFRWDETTNGMSCKIITTKTNSLKLRPDWDKKFELLRWEIGFSSTRRSQLSCKVGRPFNIYKIMYIDM